MNTFLIATEILIPIISIIVVCVIIIVVVLISLHFKHNYYPTTQIIVDVSNKRKMTNNEAFDYYVINFGKGKLVEHLNAIKEWKSSEIEKANGNIKKIKKIKERWEKNKRKAFYFEFSRSKTRYRQSNYQRYSYRVKEVSNAFNASDSAVESRIKFLEMHGYYVTYDQYNREDQRIALTKDLREMIKRRDHYTCQICGKYMPDEVGLHIDHIIPIAKGGKSIPSNLRVLCSKCNGRKGDK